MYFMKKGRDAHDSSMEKKLDYRLDRQLFDSRIDESRLTVLAFIY